MNVLVYNGPGTTVESVKACNYTLRRVLSPYYAVSNVNADTILNEPWTQSTAMIVIPGGADVPYCRALDGKGNDIIKNFVRHGGRYVGFCAGGYYGSKQIEFEAGSASMEVSGPRQLGFFPGVCRGSAFKGFQYNSHAGARATHLRVDGLRQVSNCKVPDFACYFNGGGSFMYTPKPGDNVDVLAEYTEGLDVAGAGETCTTAAVVRCKVGQGWAVLTGAHPEFGPELFGNGASTTQDIAPGIVQALETEDEKRLSFVRYLLHSIGLQVDGVDGVNGVDGANGAKGAIPQLSRLTLSSKTPGELVSAVNGIVANTRMTGNIVEGENDRFQLHDHTGQFGGLAESPAPDGTEAVKHVDIYPYYPPSKTTPCFDHGLYYSSLTTAMLGHSVLYGEVVTSTSTMLEKNYELQRALPWGFITVGTVQVSGRGRGNNVWVSPQGVLAHSAVIRIPIPQDSAAPKPNIVFVQYLVSLAVVEAIRGYGRGYEELPVRLKWPNDIYALRIDGSNNNTTNQSVADMERAASPAQYVKIGGILVSSNVVNSEYALVYGAGVNVDNAAPTTSVNALVAAINRVRRQNNANAAVLEPVKQEVLLAKIQAQLETMLIRFNDRGFEPFEAQYYHRWLHSNQHVTLEEYGNARAVIQGISKDYGLLVVRDANGLQFELQPNGNSFDMFKSLLKRKT